MNATSLRRILISKESRALRGVLALAVLIVVFGSLDAVSAATIVVTSTADDGPGTLRQAITDANLNNQPDRIEFDPTLFSSPQTIFVTGVPLGIWPDDISGARQELQIIGPGAHLLTIDGTDDGRIFTIVASVKCLVSGLTLKNGYANGPVPFGDSSGGAISIGGGLPTVSDVRIENCVFDSNKAGRSGGAIIFAGELRITNSLFVNNLAASSGGAIFNSNARLTVDNSTFSGNYAGSGSAVDLNGGYFYLTNSTVAFNHTTGTLQGGSAIDLAWSQHVTSNLYTRNSIIAKNDNINGLFTRDIESIGFQPRGYNIFGWSSEFIPGDNTGSYINVDPRLDPVLRLRGGTIPTHAIGFGSVALDTGTNCVLTDILSGGCGEPPVLTDARGVLRPQDGTGDASAIVDIGAFEATPAEISAAPGIPDLSTECDDGVSNTDNVTTIQDLTFTVPGITPGALVEFYRDSVLVDTKQAVGNTLTFIDNGRPLNAANSYFAIQTIGDLSSIPSASLDVRVDHSAPTVSIGLATGQVDPSSSQPIRFRVLFSEPVVGFDVSDLSVSGTAGGISSASIQITGGPANYTVSVSGLTGDGTVILGLATAAATDLVSNPTGIPTIVDNAVLLDTGSPSVTINQAATQTDPTRTQPVRFTVVFSEPVTGFAADDILLTGSTAGVSSATRTITGTGPTYTVSISGIASGVGTVVASVRSDAAFDGAGLNSLASTSTDNTVLFDNVRPTVTIEQAVGQADPTNQLPLNYSVVFSEPVTGFDAADIQLTGGTTSGAQIQISGTGTTYNVSIANITANGDLIRAQVRSGGTSDPAGNTNLASTSLDNAVFLDNLGPVVTVERGLTQAATTSTLPVVFRVSFNQSVTGFDFSDIDLSLSTANMNPASLSIQQSGPMNYDVSVGTFVSNGGSVVLRVNAGAVVDSFGNPSGASINNANSVTVDNVLPTVTVNQAVGQLDPASTLPLNFSVLFSESVTGFTASDVSLAGSSANVSGAQITVTGSGASYNVAVRGIATSGSILMQISAGAATDPLNNISVASTSTDNSVFFLIAKAPFDYDGDGRTDVSTFRPSNGTWYVGRSGLGDMYVQPWGLAGDTIVPADYDGDGKTDLAVRRPSDDNFYVVNSSNSTVEVRNFGIAGDIPIPSDYNGDGKADVAVWRPSNGTWYLSLSGSGIFYVMPWGFASDKPAPGDFDGDGKTELVVFRPSDGKWYGFSTVTGTISVTEWGVNGDRPVQGDYNGDGRTDFAVYRASNNTWYRQNSNDGAVSSAEFGLPNDFPVPGDYDGDGKIDVAVWRPSDATWYVRRSSSSIFTQTFGLNGDTPTPSALVF